MDRVDSTRIGAYGMTIFSFINSPHNCVSAIFEAHKEYQFTESKSYATLWLHYMPSTPELHSLFVYKLKCARVSQ